MPHRVLLARELSAVAVRAYRQRCQLGGSQRGSRCEPLDLGCDGVRKRDGRREELRHHGQ